jgi:beta-dihydromenaquinone-9 omega-hydroxylase
MTINSDVRFARKYGPLTAKTLASNMVREAKHRKRPRPVPANIELTDFDPFDHATAADPYPRYRELLASGPVHYNPDRSIFILTRYADVRAAARADHALSSADGVT